MGKKRGRWGVPVHSGANGGEGEARASPAGPIYRPVRPVSRWRHILPGRPYPSCGHAVDLIWSAPWLALARAHVGVALAATPVALHVGDHGAVVDAFTVWEKRDETRREGRRGVPMSPCLR